MALIKSPLTPEREGVRTFICTITGEKEWPLLLDTQYALVKLKQTDAGQCLGTCHNGMRGFDSQKPGSVWWGAMYELPHTYAGICDGHHVDQGLWHFA